MFLHHYLPSLGVLTAILGVWLTKLSKPMMILSLVVIGISCLFFYPINTGIALPSDALKYWFWSPGWK
jgi:dolichyl-phosphate-mannose--protein O-mannosyl transferase